MKDAVVTARKKVPEHTPRFLYRLAVLLVWVLVLRTENVAALTSGDQFLLTLHHKDFFAPSAPTATTDRIRQVSSLTQVDFKVVNTWSAEAANAALQLTALDDVHLWVGLKSRHDRRASFVVRVDLLKNEQVIATGESAEITGLTADPTEAREITIAFGSINDPALAVGDVLALRILAKVADSSVAKSALGLRVYYDAQSRPARFGATFTSGTGPIDADGDGFTVAQGDCNDANPAIHPGAAELCNGIDDNCDGTVDEGFDVGAACSVGVGACARSGAKVCTANGTGTTCNATPGPPSAEVCNNVDDDCDGQVDEGLGTLTCGQGGCEQTVAACVNGQPAVCTPGTPKAEICGNGVDEDCNGSDLPCVTTLNIAITGPANLSSTNRSTLAVTGTVDQQATEVTCNGYAAGLNVNGFGGSVLLKEGSNIITCVAKDAAGDLGSASITVTLDSTPPRVTIDAPQNGATVVASPIAVTGIVNDLVMGTVNGAEAGVQCNGVQAQVANRRFVAEEVPLNPGVNTIICIGTDKVGNVDTDKISLTLDTTSQAKINIVSGNNQTAGIGLQLAEPLVVGLTDNGAAAVGKVVVFKVLQNDGELSANNQTGRLLAINTGADGHAAVQFKLGSWAGAGNNQVEAMAMGFAGEARFSASALAGEANSIVVDSGNNQLGAVGQQLPKPFVAVVIDRGSNRLSGVPVTFTVKEGGGNFAGQSETTVTTDTDGRAAAVLTLGPREGSDNNMVAASFPNNPGLAASFAAAGKTVGKPEDTRISGVVLDNSNHPLQSVTLHIEGTTLTTQSDGQGQFVLQPAPVGKVSLVADGSNVSPREGRPWPKPV